MEATMISATTLISDVAHLTPNEPGTDLKVRELEGIPAIAA